MSTLPYMFLVFYFVSLGVCSFSTIYKSSYFKNMGWKQILGNMFWSLIPIANTFKALLWIFSLISDWRQKKQRSKLPS